MPCHDNRGDYELAYLRDRLDLATRVACTAMKIVNELPFTNAEMIEAGNWWLRHQDDDAKRGGE